MIISIVHSHAAKVLGAGRHAYIIIPTLHVYVNSGLLVLVLGHVNFFGKVHNESAGLQ
uniref:Uncharacterized protein n=1 Tax=Arundo donax TaxID=35708 RepID=A0A0A9BDJ7_ARUDO